ncbi:MAG: hypothetical protein A3G23_03915 [Bacteroidetes bacterium RIFCSPLOWO2_12_FULL_37_12]|nr:MAG: hypothetical protein A3G23_03915 [Bacteroidetes bacterium RIFCSPLOWO2_12_FULL_37_12]
MSESKKSSKSEENKHLYFGDRRSFLSKLAWGSFFTYFGMFVFGSIRGLYPRVLFEPRKDFIAGYPYEFAPMQVDESFMSSQRVWIIRTNEGFIALSGICTHLGCTPRWLKNENKFKCPCHGSGFNGFMSDQIEIAVNFEGPAPRPLERLEISFTADGRLKINKGKKFLAEKGEWGMPGAFLPFRG